MRIPRVAPALILLLPGCATGPAVVARTAPPDAAGPEVALFYEGGERPLRRGLLPGLRGLPPDLGPSVWSARLPLRAAERAFVVDASDPARPPRLWLDAAGGGDFAGLVPATGEWVDGFGAIVSQYDTLRLPAGEGGSRDYPVELTCRVPPAGAATFTVEADGWRHGRVSLGGREFTFLLRDADADGDYADLGGLRLGFDRDGDGTVDLDLSSGEGYPGDARFDLGTGTHRLARVSEDGSEAAFEPAWPPAAVLPFTGAGDVAPPIPGTDLDGNPISLAEFRGRRVLLLFWAEW